jgi:hypothetical protein
MPSNPSTRSADGGVGTTAKTFMRPGRGDWFKEPYPIAIIFFGKF